MRSGITTGACAALAAKGAVALLATGEAVPRAEIPLPEGARLGCALASLRLAGEGAEAAVIKDAGDDPDITHGATVKAHVRWNDAGLIRFLAGEGVGTVTRPGLAIPPGEPAINPGPRRLIEESLREVTDRGVDVTISIPGGQELAGKTFNPRLGIEGGLSVLGTTGRVRPFSAEGLRDSLLCSLSVAVGAGIRRPVLVPGHIGASAAARHFRLGECQLVEVSNEWGYMLERCNDYTFEALLALGHPGKLAKLAAGEWQTHSAHSSSPVPFVRRLAEQILGRPLEEAVTIEGLFSELGGPDRGRVADALAGRIRAAILEKFSSAPEIAVVLINLKGEILGSEGGVELWK